MALFKPEQSHSLGKSKIRDLKSQIGLHSHSHAAHAAAHAAHAA